jgi:hypothetical protein
MVNSETKTLEDKFDLIDYKFKKIDYATQTSDQRVVRLYKNWTEAITNGNFKLAERHQERSRKHKYLSINGLEKSEFDRMKAELNRFTDFQIKKKVFLYFKNGLLTYNL